MNSSQGYAEHCFNPLPAFGPGDTRAGRVDCGSGKFQSAPGFWAGRYLGSSLPSPWAWACFNPLPAFGPGDTFCAPDWSATLDVSIRSRLLGREIPCKSEVKVLSIKFQSAPGFWAGRYFVAKLFFGFHGLFQSAPGFWAGRYIRHAVSFAYMNVSIRSRLLGREIRGLVSRLHTSGRFQSAPGFWAGRYNYQ